MPNESHLSYCYVHLTRLGLHHLSYQAQQKQAAADIEKEIQDAKGGEDPHTPTVSPITLASRPSVAFSSVAHCATPPTPTVSPITLASRPSVAFSSVAHCATPPTSHAATPSLSPGGTAAAAAAVTGPPITFGVGAPAAAAASGGGGWGGDFLQKNQKQQEQVPPIVTQRSTQTTDRGDSGRGAAYCDGWQTTRSVPYAAKTEGYRPARTRWALPAVDMGD
jgi:hypothetical protein